MFHLLWFQMCIAHEKEMLKCCHANAQETHRAQFLPGSFEGKSTHMARGWLSTPCSSLTTFSCLLHSVLGRDQHVQNTKHQYHHHDTSTLWLLLISMAQHSVCSRGKAFCAAGKVFHLKQNCSLKKKKTILQV